MTPIIYLVKWIAKRAHLWQWRATDPGAGPLGWRGLRNDVSVFARRTRYSAEHTRQPVGESSAQRPADPE